MDLSFTLQGPSINGAKLLFQVIKAMMIMNKVRGHRRKRNLGKVGKEIGLVRAIKSYPLPLLRKGSKKFLPPSALMIVLPVIMEINSRRKCKELIELDIPVQFLELSFNLFKAVLDVIAAKKY